MSDAYVLVGSLLAQGFVIFIIYYAIWGRKKHKITKDKILRHFMLR